MYITFDVGGTNTRIGVSHDGKTIVDKTAFPTDPHNYEKNLTVFANAVAALTEGSPITAVAGGVPGPLIEGGQGVGSAPNLPDWRGRLFARDLQEKLGAPVFLENDTATIGIGEATAGAGRGHSIVIYVTISTGVGGCRIVDGVIDKSARGFEPGHQIINPNGPDCTCGGKGHLEAVLGGASMEAQHNKPPKEIDDPAVWDTAAKHLAIGLNNMLVLWSPHIFVLGGSMMNDISIPKTQEYLEELVTLYDELPPIVPAQLKGEAGFLGSLAVLSTKGM